MFTAIAATVAALPAPDPGWTAPTPDLTFGGGCTGVITGARLASALGASGSLDVETHGSPALDLVGGSDCRWTSASDYSLAVYITVLPGGAWAQDAAKAAMVANGAPVPTPAVTGVPAGATALYYHVDATALDVVLGGTWIKIAIGNGPSSPEAALAAIGADIAAHAH